MYRFPTVSVLLVSFVMLCSNNDVISDFVISIFDISVFDKFTVDNFEFDNADFSISFSTHWSNRSSAAPLPLASVLVPHR
jgi:hypothetical protein